MPFFSICIPAYKNIHYLQRLLDTVFEQTFTDYEVIITDDSPDGVIKDFLNVQYPNKVLKYYRNRAALGTPENWNKGIRLAKGTWIKLMHDDDWFCTNNALQILYDHVQNHKSDFYFSAYYNIYLDEQNRKELVNCPSFRWKRIVAFPANLYARNIIGPPSVTLIKNGLDIAYDNRMKWLVDIDYYIRLMQDQQPVYINEPLVNVGMGSAQVTTCTHNKPEVEIPEGLLLCSKLNAKVFDHILYFDAWWRLLRNVKIRDIRMLNNYAAGQQVPATLYRMVAVQKSIPYALLCNGIVSKIFMSLTWVYNKLSA